MDLIITLNTNKVDIIILVHHSELLLYHRYKLLLYIYLCTASASVSHTEMVWHMAGIICKRERERERVRRRIVR